ncbi:methyltransferase domain-containing protein [Microbacteriaceae bacterium VKM Ac-2854]|nr:methyltransferase domain-containing protein [Microbacteriaceae bacterium VKM Ac-2854]
MDDPECDPARLDRTYAQFRTVNALVSGWRRVYRSRLRPRLERDRENTLLDIGFGGGDVPRALAGWARRDGFALQVTAIDPDPRAHAFVSAQPPTPGVHFERASSAELDGRFDLVTSNHVLHHLDPAGLDELLADSERLGRYCVHNDLARSRVAYSAYSVATRPLRRGSFLHDDGALSIRRSFTAAELRAAAPGWRVETLAPYRLLLSHEESR